MVFMIAPFVLKHAEQGTTLLLRLWITKKVDLKKICDLTKYFGDK
jgi:hypothetical protein